MNLKEEQIEALYVEIANGDELALEFIKLWSLYCHQVDDLVDVKFNIEELIKTNNNFLRMLTTQFFSLNQRYLIGQIYLAAESYLASEHMKFSGRYEERLYGTYLSHEGNNMLLQVALITGGFDHLQKIAPKVRQLTYLEHPLEEKNV